MSSASSTERGRPTILVVEDNYLTAATLCDIVQDCGFAVAGPAARLDLGLDLIANQKVDGALVDINLGGTESYPLCAALDRRKVPFALVTAYSSSSIPPAFRAAPLLAKPVDPQQIRTTLGAFNSGSFHQLAPAKPPPGNSVLDMLDPDDQRRLGPMMEPVSLEAGRSLETPGKVPTHLVFPTTGVVSIRIPTDGYDIEAALVGREGMTGIVGIMDAGPSAFEAKVHVPGAALQVPMRALLADLAYNRRLQGRLLASAYGFLRQVAQTMLASSQGTIEERVARWLLMMSDRLDSDEIFETHEGIARLLGVRRAGVTVALHILEGKRAIRSDRKRVRIIDRWALRLVAGPFYEDPAAK